MTTKSHTNSQKKSHFNITQLSEAFGISRPTITKMLGKSPAAGKIGRSDYWDLKDIATLNDVRDPYVPPESTKSDGDNVPEDPAKMKPFDRVNYYKAEDLKQSTLLKQRKNAQESRLLIPAEEVEFALADGFKKVALTLDTLPDALERDGIIGSDDISKLIDLIDRARSQLARDLSELSPTTNEIDKRGEW